MTLSINLGLDRMKTTGIAGKKLENLDALTSIRFFSAAAMIVILQGNAILNFNFVLGFGLAQRVTFFCAIAQSMYAV